MARRPSGPPGETQLGWLDDLETREDHDKGLVGSLRRSFRTTCLVLIFLLSLLSFPSVTPWVTAFWISWMLGRMVQKKTSWPPLVACLVTLLLRPVALTPVMSVFIIVLLLASIALFRVGTTPNQRQRWAVVSVLAIAWVAMLVEWRAIENTSPLPDYDFSRPIVCLGDSLTEGLHPDGGYPAALQSLVKPEVINLGFSGIASSQGLGQLDRVLSHNPQLVIIELGGHDFLKGHSRVQTHHNLTKLIRTCKEHGSDVLLMEIPRGFIFDLYASLERQIAYEEDVQLLSDTWLRQIILRSPIAPPGMWMPKESHLSNDGIHSNQQGSTKIAHDVASAIEVMYGESAMLQTEG